MKDIKIDGWHRAALDFGKLDDTFVALSPRANPVSWLAWRNYFRWLNWAPHWFLEVERSHAEDPTSPRTWTAPADNPDKFTIRFEPARCTAPAFSLEATRPMRAPLMPRLQQIETMRAQGKLTFDGGPLQKQDHRSWYDRLGSSQAQNFLDEARAVAENHQKPSQGV